MEKLEGYIPPLGDDEETEYPLLSREEERVVFENEYGAEHRVQAQSYLDKEGKEMRFESFEVFIDPHNKGERHSYLHNFMLCAARAGYEQLFSPVALPIEEPTSGEDNIPLMSVSFFLRRNT